MAYRYFYSHSDLPHGDGPRAAWKALGKKKRRAIIRAARRRSRWPDDSEAQIAYGWAIAVLGTTSDEALVHTVPVILDVILAVMDPHALRGDVLDGSASNDDNPFVRRAARRVAQANGPAQLP